MVSTLNVLTLSTYFYFTLNKTEKKKSLQRETTFAHEKKLFAFTKGIIFA